MQIYHAVESFPTPPDGCVATIGNFDGVHLGHQAIIAHARSLAQREGLPLVALTFDPSPLKFLRPDKAPRLLTPIELKALLLEDQRVDSLLVIKPTQAFLSLSPEEFARHVLIEKLQARHVVEGQTFGFGQRRSGSMVSLQELGDKFGFGAHLVPSRKIELDGSPVAVSSTLIRQYLATSQFGRAKPCLGRPYILGGRVVAGRQTGRKLGFPTANLQLYQTDQLTPEDGVFAGWACVGSSPQEAWRGRRKYQAAISVGCCETFADGVWQIEAYFLDYAPSSSTDELYDQHLLLSFVHRLRPQQRFDSPADLTRAIDQDCRAIRQLLLKKEPSS